MTHLSKSNEQTTNRGDDHDTDQPERDMLRPEAHLNNNKQSVSTTSATATQTTTVKHITAFRYFNDDVTHVKLNAEPLDRYLDTAGDRVNFANTVKHNVDSRLLEETL